MGTVFVMQVWYCWGFMSSVHFPFFPDFKFMQHLITLNCVVSILSTFGKNLMMIFFLLEFFHVVVTLNVCVCVWVCVCAWCTICCNLHQILSIPVESGEGVCLLCKEQQLLQCSNYNNEASDLICTSSVANIWKPTVEKVSLVLFSLPRWEAVDTEIKVPSGENTEFKRSPFKALSSSVFLLKPWVVQYIAIYATLTSRDFLLISTLPVLSPAFFPKPHPIFSCVGCG